jgi:uracil-DNA glycosylase family 4
MGDERTRLIREVRQRLESLRRAGLVHLPAPSVPAEPAPRAVSATADRARITPESTGPAAPPVAPEPPRRLAVEPAPQAGPARIAALFEEPALEGEPVPEGDRPTLLAALAAEVAACERCPLLASTRTRTVFGEGSPTARLMFIGEAPGADEDRTGRPFVGRAGVLLTAMITEGMGLSRDQVYIANVLKSRPPENRTPSPDEVGHCLPFLERQVEIIRPEFLCLLGKTAASALLDTALSMGGLRRRWHRYRGIPTLVTYHPSYLLRTPSAKKDAWEDLKMLMRAMGITPPSRKKG